MFPLGKYKKVAVSITAPGTPHTLAVLTYIHFLDVRPGVVSALSTPKILLCKHLY